MWGLLGEAVGTDFTEAVALGDGDAQGTEVCESHLASHGDKGFPP